MVQLIKPKTAGEIEMARSIDHASELFENEPSRASRRNDCSIAQTPKPNKSYETNASSN
jgi:hypothetical protein